MGKTGKGSVKVEQICREKVIYDYDQTYSPSELRRIISWYFHTNDSLIGEYGNIKYRIHVKNITYLGKPWELYKKRIQLWPNLLELIQKDYESGFIPLIVGVYHYNRTTVFADFDVDSYIDKKSNNSAAHIHTYDLQRAIKEGLYSKTDRNGNHIAVFSPGYVDAFLFRKFSSTPHQTPIERVNELLYDFYVSIPSHWNGIDCYKQMAEINHPKQRETEWPGFYHEVLFEQFLNSQPERKKIICFQQNKAKGDLDFDLFYPEMNCFGDLKCHTIGEQDIPGNKIENLISALEAGPLYYVICEHLTEKDSPPDYETLTFWNKNVRDKKKRGSNVDSQKGRMKASVDLIDFVVVQIDQYNYSHLSSFQKGFMNSNNIPRGEKFSIPMKLLEDFIIHKDLIVNRGALPADFPSDQELKACVMKIIQTASEGVCYEEIKKRTVIELRISQECLSVLINEKSHRLLIDVLLEHSLIQLKKQGKILKTRVAGETKYKTAVGT